VNLIEAIIHQDVNAVRQLLEQGVNPNACQDNANVTPLHFAALHNALEIVPLLITAGANLHAQTYPEGQTPLDIAKLHKHQDMVKLLSDFNMKCQ